MARCQELLRSLNNLKLLGAIGRSDGDLGSIADLDDDVFGSPQMAAIVQRFHALPGGAELRDSRDPPLQPDTDQLILLPGSSPLGGGLLVPADREPYGLDRQLGVLAPA